ncbi:MAG TPA: hypothetical protein VN715_00350 [Roseiarcus sp.]|nr:hypothetical protein [Roseiarcus sp.]
MSALMTISRTKPVTRESAVKPPTEKNCLNTPRFLSRLQGSATDAAGKNLLLRQDFCTKQNFCKKTGWQCLKTLLTFRLAGSYISATQCATGAFITVKR